MTEAKKYKCKDCQKERSLLTLGDMYEGCADCGGRSGFEEFIDGKWVEVEKTEEGDTLNDFMSNL